MKGLVWISPFPFFYKTKRRYRTILPVMAGTVWILVACNKPDHPGPSVSVPVISTSAASIITHATAKSGASISSDGGAIVTVRGICWSTNPSPTTASNKTASGSGTGVFTSWVTGLSDNTTYYVRAYATNSAGTAYGNEISFKTQAISATSVTDIDGNVYDIVTIGTQVWMQENLKTTHYRNGDTIATGLNDAEWGATTNGAYSNYNNDEANNNVYGKLYNWYAATDNSNIAPDGWHVPSEEEWNTLIFSSLGGLTDAGGKMKEDGTTHWNSPNTGASNSSGFTGLPGGFRMDTGVFNFLGNGGYWWSTTPSGQSEAEVRGLFNNTAEAAQITGSKSYGISVRCVKD